MFAVALAAALFTLWHHRARARRVVAFLASENAHLVAQAPRAELLLLAGDATPAEPEATLPVRGAPHAIVERLDLSDSPYLSELRESLLKDANYGWESADKDCQPRWTHALRFYSASESVTLLFAFNCEQVLVAGQEPSASIAPLAPALQAFFNAQSQKPDSRGRRRAEALTRCATAYRL